MRFLSRVVLALAIVGLSGCDRSGSGKAADQRQVTLNVAFFKSPATDAAIALIPEFEHQSGIKVSFEALPYNELQDKLQTVFLAKTAQYDVVMADCIWIPKFAEAGHLRNIDGYLKDQNLTPTAFKYDDIVTSVGDYLGRYPKNGTTYGFPFMTNTHVLAYREDLFKKYLEPAGFAPPGMTLETAWTWDDYLRASKLLTKDFPDAPGGHMWGSSMQARAGAWLVYEWYDWLYGFGGADFDYATMKARFDSPEVIAAMKAYASMVGTVAPPGVTSWGHEEETQALASGQCAMDATWNVELTEYLVGAGKSPFTKEFRFALSPKRPGGTPTPDMGGYGILLSAYSRHPTEAYRFMVWLTSPEIHQRIVLAGGTPYRYSALRDPEVLQKYPVYKIYGKALELSIYRARVPQWPEIQDVISKELTAVLLKQKSAEDAATAMQTRVTEIVGRP